MIKNGHENDIAFYDQKMHEEKQIGLMIESSMQEALDTGEFRLYLQAKKDLRGEKISERRRWCAGSGRMAQ